MSKTSSSRNCLDKILTDWNFPLDIIHKYKILGIEQIFDWQYECLKNNQQVTSESRKSFVYAAPTSAGKTLVAELLMLKNVLDTKRKAIMILPYVSLAKEKLKHLQKLSSHFCLIQKWILSDSFLKADGFIGNASANGGFQAIDIAVCTIEKANSLINKLIDEELVFDLSAIVVDELHMVNEANRGYLIELILTKIKFLCIKNSNFKVQIIGMSATLPNLNLIAEWLGAKLYETDFRPIELVEYVKFENEIYNREKTMQRRIEADARFENDTEHLVQLVYETVVHRLGVLIFCPTKARCETLAENIARSIFLLEKNHKENLSFLQKEKIVELSNELKATTSGLDSLLAKTIKYGVAFHHAGLTIEERDILEKHFKKGTLLVMVCTSTLSSGINLPARRVIIRTPVFNGRPLDLMNYKQMAGRAGRKGIDTHGECLIMCSNSNEKRIGEMLLNSANLGHNWKPQKSQNVGTDLNASLKRAILETIVSGIASKKSEILDYLKCFIQNKIYDDEDNVINCEIDYEKYLKWLNANQFVDIISTKNHSGCDEVYKPTQLGFAVVGSSMSPDEGLLIYGELQRAMQCFVLENELHIIYQITPMNICDYWTLSSAVLDWNLFYTLLQGFPSDVKRVSDLVGVRQSFILKMIKGATISSSSSATDQKLHRIHIRFFTSLILNDLVNEMPFKQVLTKYACQKGFLQTLQQSSSTCAAMITVFCNRLSWHNLELLVNQFQSRLMFGVQKQLLDLVRIKLLNAHRARLFYNSGYTTCASLAMCELKIVERILRSSMQFSLNLNNNHDDANNNNNSEVVIWCENVGYTYWQAAQCILDEANQLLRNDLELMGVKISSSTEKKELSNNAINENMNTNTNNKPMNRSIFVFNETIDSTTIMIQSQTGLKPAKIEEHSASVEKKEKEEKVQQFKALNLTKLEQSRLVDKEKEEKKKNVNESMSNTQLDDLFILEIADSVENQILKPKSLSESFNNNNNNNETTILSEEILEMCEKFEKNALLSSKRKSIAFKEKENLSPLNKKLETNTKRSLNFSLGDVTLRNILNTQQDSIAIELSPKENSSHQEKMSHQKLDEALSQLEQKFHIKISLIENLKCLQNFLSTTLKPKSILSLSLACRKAVDSSGFAERNLFFTFYDQEKQISVQFCGIFLCIHSEQCKNQFYFILFKSGDQFYLNLLRKVFERDDLTRILFYTKSHLKLVLKSLRMTATSNLFYDPIIANWLLTQEVATIFQIKQKYCSPNSEISIDSTSFFKNKRTCYGCSLTTMQSSLSTLLHGSLLECMIAVRSFEKIKLQLQLQNLWIYFTKVESAIATLSSRIEFVGFGLNVEKLERVKSLLLNKKKEIEEKVSHMLDGQEANLNSVDQVAFILYDKLKLRPVVVAEENKPQKIAMNFRHHSTSKDVLMQLGKQHEFPKLVILWRKINHALNNSLFLIEKVI